MNIKDYLKLMIKKNASDMFYRAGGHVRQLPYRAKQQAHEKVEQEQRQQPSFRRFLPAPA